METEKKRKKTEKIGTRKKHPKRTKMEAEKNGRKRKETEENGKKRERHRSGDPFREIPSFVGSGRARQCGPHGGADAGVIWQEVCEQPGTTKPVGQDEVLLRGRVICQIARPVGLLPSRLWRRLVDQRNPRWAGRQGDRTEYVTNCHKVSYDAS